MTKSESKFRPFAVGEEPPPPPPTRTVQREKKAGGKGGGGAGASSVKRGKSGPRIKKLRDFTTFTLHDLPRAQIAVWLAIFNCEHDGQAQIGQDRIVELSGTSKKHVGKAIKSLVARGLLEVIAQGRFRPGKNKGLTSLYVLHGQPKVSAS